MKNKHKKQFLVLKGGDTTPSFLFLKQALYVGYIHFPPTNIVNNFVNNFFNILVAHIKKFCIFAV